ncbi:hypothetical protein B0H15DRAFT_497405 [Mycena belliarum]|uniref:Uncharacterized protein n=1 Tax=Mycena belliarum TaxID=1033014 RepID=A0AAD6TZT9_9AGAR|nr:hypothetical protein B0H15DRAFT_497405 [Mycena belliae]
MANHQDLNQSLLNGAHVLCSQEEWLWDGFDNNRLIFFADGTGEMISRAEVIVKIVAGIQWKLLPSAKRVPKPPRETTVVPPAHWREIWFQRMTEDLKEPTTVFAGIMELTITKRRPLLYGTVVHNQINEEVLLDGAFETRRIDIVIETGEFGLACHYGPLRNGSIGPIYGFRLTFSTTPYPPMEMWKPEEHNVAEMLKHPHMKQFCARKLADEARSSTCSIM